MDLMNELADIYNTPHADLWTIAAASMYQSACRTYLNSTVAIGSRHDMIQRLNTRIFEARLRIAISLDNSYYCGRIGGTLSSL